MMVKVVTFLCDTLARVFVILGQLPRILIGIVRFAESKFIVGAVTGLPNAGTVAVQP
jgi:uncharacterized membrane protein YuzA (DUF378 family)